MLRALMLLDENDRRGKRTPFFPLACSMETSTQRAYIWVQAMLEAGFIRKVHRVMPYRKKGRPAYNYHITEKGRQMMYLLEDVLAMIKPV